MICLIVNHVLTRDIKWRDLLSWPTRGIHVVHPKFHACLDHKFKAIFYFSGKLKRRLSLILVLQNGILYLATFHYPASLELLKDFFINDENSKAKAKAKAIYGEKQVITLQFQEKKMSYSPPPQGSALIDDYPLSGKQVDEGRGGEDPPQRHESRHQNQQQQRHPPKNNNPDKHNSTQSSHHSQQQQIVPPSAPSSSSRTLPKDDPKARDLSNDHQSPNQSSASIQAPSHQKNLPQDTHQLPGKSSSNTQKKQEDPDPTLSNFPVKDVEGDHLSKTKNQPKLQSAPGETNRKVDQERNSHSLQDHSNGGELSRKPLPVPGGYPPPRPTTSPPKLEPLPVAQGHRPPRPPSSRPKREALPVPDGYPPHRPPSSLDKLEPRPKKGWLEKICPCFF